MLLEVIDLILHYRLIFLLLLLRIIRLPRLQYPLLPINHRIHMVNKRRIRRITVYHRKRIHRINERTVGGIGGGAGLLHNAHLTGSIRFRALGGSGEESIFFRLQIVYPHVKGEGSPFGGIEGFEVLQEIVQHAALLGLRQRCRVAVLVEQRLGFTRGTCYVCGRVSAHRFDVGIGGTPRLVALHVGIGRRGGSGIRGGGFQGGVEGVESGFKRTDGCGECGRGGALHVGQAGFFFALTGQVFGFGEDEFQESEIFFHAEGSQADGFNLFHNSILFGLTCTSIGVFVHIFVKGCEKLQVPTKPSDDACGKFLVLPEPRTGVAEVF